MKTKIFAFLMFLGIIISQQAGTWGELHIDIAMFICGVLLTSHAGFVLATENERKHQERKNKVRK